MPDVNGKFYMNPAYGRAVEGSRGHKVALDKSARQLSTKDAHWVTIDGHHVLIQESQSDGLQQKHHQDKQKRPAIELPTSNDERRLTVIVFNETGGLTPLGSSEKRNAADLHAARVAAAEISKRAIESGHDDRVAPDEIQTGLWQGLHDKNPVAIDAWNDSSSAARSALAGSNTTKQATHFRLDAKAGTIPRWAQGRQPSQTFGPFQNAGGGDARTPTTRAYVYP